MSTAYVSRADVAPGDGPELPFVSLVLPVRNEERHIRGCLERLIDQDYPPDRLEIIVVDGCSSDATRERIGELQATAPSVVIRVLENPAGTVPPALNIGIRAARGAVIARMDGHTVPPRDYVRRCVDALARSGAANVGGVVVPVGTSRLGEAVAAATRHPLGVGDAKYRIGGEGYVDTVPFGTFRRWVFEDVGLFDESMVRNQDYEMNVRIRAAGHGIYLDPDIRTTYFPRGDARSLWRQYFQYGWWRVETVRRHPRSLRWRQAVPPAFVLALIALTLLAPIWWLAAWAWVALLAVYATTVMAVSLAIAPGGRAPHLVAAAFFTMHVAYGLGFLANLASGSRFPYRARAPVVPRLSASDGRSTAGAGTAQAAAVAGDAR